jgi:hypothetical protein
MHRTLTIAFCAGVLSAIACPGEPGSGNAGQLPGTGGLPRFGHVVIVVEENHDYADVVGGGTMPYLNGLIAAYGSATQYYANTHPSIGNYFMLTTGRIITNDDGFTGVVSEDNIVRRLVAAGKRWKAYAEDLPSVGYLGDGPGAYARRHNPLSYLSDVVNDPAQRRNLVPFPQFHTDLAGDSLPDFAFLVPNLCHDAHDCALDSADAWLRTNLPPLLTDTAFLRDGLLIIVFDEADHDDSHGGGRIAWAAVSPWTRRGFRSGTLYQHQSTLRLMAEGLGLTTFPGAAATAPNMAEFFTSPPRSDSEGAGP